MHFPLSSSVCFYQDSCVGKMTSKGGINKASRGFIDVLSVAASYTYLRDLTYRGKLKYAVSFTGGKGGRGAGCESHKRRAHLR